MHADKMTKTTTFGLVRFVWKSASTDRALESVEERERIGLSLDEGKTVCETMQHDGPITHHKTHIHCTPQTRLLQQLPYHCYINAIDSHANVRCDRVPSVPQR